MHGQLTIVLVRFCECAGTLARLIGRYDDLTEAGRGQAQALQRAIDRPIAVLAPNNPACLQTAEILAGGGAVEKQPAFRAPSYPSWAGLTLAEIAERWPREWASFLEPEPGDADRVLAPGGESLRATYERAKEGLDLAFSRYRDSGGAVVVVTHGEVVRLLTIGLLGAPLENLFLIRSQNGSASRFSYDGSSAIFDTINDTSHLGGLTNTDLISLATGR